jgi:hypothetical protein
MTRTNACSGPLRFTAEIASIFMLLVVAGHETTANLLGNLVLHLLGRPEGWEAVRADPSLVSAAVEEALRIDAPVQVLHRVTTGPLTIDGRALPSGTKIFVPFGAANHDDRIFDNPDCFDLRRSGAKRHLAFSKGVHYCLGAPLARPEGRVALEVLTGRLPGLGLAGDDIRYNPVFPIRSLHNCPSPGDRRILPPRAVPRPVLGFINLRAFQPASRIRAATSPSTTAPARSTLSTTSPASISWSHSAATHRTRETPMSTSSPQGGSSCVVQGVGSSLV